MELYKKINSGIPEHNFEEIKYQNPVKLYIGDVVYMIEVGDSKLIYPNGPCKVCEGAGQLTVNGVTFSCPCCTNSNKSNDCIHVSRYIVNRYIVKKYRVVGVSADIFDPMHWATSQISIRFKLCTKVCKPQYRNREIKLKYKDISNETYGNKTYNIELTDDLLSSYTFRKDTCERLVYTDYLLAVKVAEVFNQHEEKLLLKHEEKYEYPTDWECKNDAK